MTTPKEKAKQTRERKRLEEEQRQLLEEQEQQRELLHSVSMKHAFDLLESEVAGLYDEMDKLAKKAPNEPVTDLQLRILNNFIKKAKRLLAGDTIIDEVEVFAAAGDNAEYRDVVTVLRQIRQGLQRFKDTSQPYIFTKAFTDELSQWEFDEEPGDFFADIKTQNGAAQ